LQTRLDDVDAPGVWRVCSDLLLRVRAERRASLANHRARAQKIFAHYDQGYASSVCERRQRSERPDDPGHQCAKIFCPRVRRWPLATSSTIARTPRQIAATTRPNILGHLHHQSGLQVAEEKALAAMQVENERRRS